MITLNNNKILQTSTLAGKLLLENGAEIYRVEETICKICNAYGIDNVDSYVTPTGIMVSLTENNETFSIVKRVTNRRINLNIIDQINDLSRKVAVSKIPIESFNDKLLEIKHSKNYSLKTSTLFSGITSFGFSLMFGGSVLDGICAFIIGIPLNLLVFYLTSKKINSFFINFLGGAFVAFLALIFNYFNICQHIDKTIVGTIMLLVPGLAITNAIRDVIAGDYLSGVVRGAEAFLTAIAIAVGSGTILSIFINTIGGKI